WLSGGAVVLPNSRETLNASVLNLMISSHQITYFELSFGQWQEWLCWLRYNNKIPSQHLRAVMVGCAPIPQELILQWREYNIPLISVFGLTETTITTTTWVSNEYDMNQYSVMP